jgi:hypothetical protein
VPRSLPSRLGRLAVTSARRAGPASATRCFAALSSGNARLFAGEFVRCSFLVRRASTLGCDRALCLRIHRGKSAWRLAAHGARVSRVPSAVISVSARPASASTPHSAGPASLVHSLPLVVGLVRHYRSPRRDIRKLSRSRLPDITRSAYVVGARPCLNRTLMRKRQAAISGRGRTARPSPKLWISSLLSRV